MKLWTKHKRPKDVGKQHKSCLDCDKMLKANRKYLRYCNDCIDMEEIAKSAMWRSKTIPKFETERTK